MNPFKVTIQNLFSLQCQYIIPIFQRRYVWSEQNQWAPLWDDILHLATSLLISGHTPRKHFMGAVVLRPLIPKGLQYQSFDVIDGQQRLTTLQILLIALHDVATMHNVSPVIAMTKGMIVNPELAKAEYEQWKVVPTSTDRSSFKDVWESGSADQLLHRHPVIKLKHKKQPEPHPPLVAGYHYFTNVIRRFAETNTDLADDPTLVDAQTTMNRLTMVARAITQHLELVRIDLDPDDDPQVIFETLNYNGVRLLPGDLVRNYVFLEAARQYENQTQVTAIYENFWREYDTGPSAAFWRNVVRQGRITHPRFELFLFHFLTSQIERPEDDIQLSQLYRAFSEWWARGPQGGRDVITALTIIRDYASFYRRLFTVDDEDRVAIFGRRMQIMDVSTILPLVLFLGVERKNETAHELHGILDDLESYLVRRMISGLTTKGYNRIFVKLMTDLRKGGVVTRAAVQKHLLALSGPTAEWPTDEQFQTRWMTSKVYENLRQARVVMVLEALEWAQHTSFQEQRPSSAITYSIEHILPQNPGDTDWALPPNIDEQTRQNALLARETLKHSFGNLTLVTPSMNSWLSNDPFAIKLKGLNDSTLMLNKYFSKNLITSWDVEQIRERGGRLFTTALTIWSRPASPAAS